MGWLHSERETAAAELEAIYAEVERLARQLAEHAQRAPYPHVEERLRELHVEQERTAEEVAVKLAELGRRASPDGRPTRGGRNAWERLAATIEDYRRLINRLAQLEIRWEDERPEDALFLHRLRRQASAHRDALADLLARSDPHAID